MLDQDYRSCPVGVDAEEAQAKWLCLNCYENRRMPGEAICRECEEIECANCGEVVFKVDSVGGRPQGHGYCSESCEAMDQTGFYVLYDEDRDRELNKTHMSHADALARNEELERCNSVLRWHEG